MIPGIPDTVLVALIAVTGVLVGALVAVLGHLVLARSAQQNRTWTAVWPKKAGAYEELLQWSQGAGSRTGNEVWVLAQAYGSDRVRQVIDDYLRDSSAAAQSQLQTELGAAIREDLRTNIKLN